MYYVLWIMIAYFILFLIRLIKGPSIWDRLLGMNLVSSKIIIIIVVFASLHNTGYLLDFAIIYALFGFIGAIFIALFLAERSKEEQD